MGGGAAGGGVKLKVCTTLKIVLCNLLFAELQLRDVRCESCLQQPARVVHMQMQSENPFLHTETPEMPTSHQVGQLDG